MSSSVFRHCVPFLSSPGAAQWNSSWSACSCLAGWRICQPWQQQSTHHTVRAVFLGGIAWPNFLSMKALCRCSALMSCHASGVNQMYCEGETTYGISLDWGSMLFLQRNCCMSRHHVDCGRSTAPRITNTACKSVSMSPQRSSILRIPSLGYTIVNDFASCGRLWKKSLSKRNR